MEDGKNFKKDKLVRDYKELIEWLVLLYKSRRCKVEDEQTRLIMNAYESILKIAQLIETFEYNLKQ